MPIEYRTENKKGYFLVTTHGRNNDLEAISNYAREVTELCKKHDCSCMLIDERNRLYNLDEVLDQYKLANYFKTLGIANIRIAIVCKPQYLEKVRFIETTANNRGISLKYFVDMDSAERWLQ